MNPLKHMNGLRITNFGYSNSGKTYTVGSLNALQYEVGPQGFKISGKDKISVGRVEKIYNAMTNKTKDQFIGTTEKIDDIPLVLQQGRDSLFDIELSDIVGQGTEGGRNDEEARILMNRIRDYDGIFMLVKAPNDDNESFEARAELSRLVYLADGLLSKGVPVALLITQIDKLSALQKVNSEIENKIHGYSDMARSKPNIYHQYENKEKFFRGDIINSMVSEAMAEKPIKDLIRHFKQIIKGRIRIPYRVFPTSSLGFENSAETPYGTESSASTQLYPYGTIAAFFWMIFACSKVNPNRRLDSNFRPNELLIDLADLITSGQAYQDTSDPAFNLRDLSDLTR